ncbi:MAG: dipeptidase [Planctomycetota bacterium]|jgi:membrane dipeptidase
MDKHLILDIHLDLSMNAMEWNRDFRSSVEDIRLSEMGMEDKPDRAKNTVSFQALREGNIGIVVATQIARYVKQGSSLPGWNSQEQAWSQTQGQLAWYKTMEESGFLTQIIDRESLEAQLSSWDSSDQTKPIGYILSLEGADSIISMSHLERAYEQGLRAIGPAHYGPGIYAQGTNATGGLGLKGCQLLKEMERLNIILDITHLCDESFFEAMDSFGGAIWASHHNCRNLVPHNRQLGDEQIKLIIEREGVIGIPLDAWMMVPDWRRRVSTPESENVTLQIMIDHMDHICQLAGNANHVGIGSDLDGAFGKEQCPIDLDTIADLQKLTDLLKNRGYVEDDIDRILSQNVIDFLLQIWS